ncbi:MAG TPA: carbohydrate kinase family protein [Ignavibacteria bacterium]
MKYLVIGEPCVDVIHKADGDKIHSYGGILYSVIALSVLSAPEDEILPVMNLGEDEYENITGILKGYSNINMDGVYKVGHPTRKVNLYYNIYNSGKSARLEQSTDPTYTLDYKDSEKFLPGADGVLVNMISGVDITLDTLKKLRTNFNGKIHMDLHNLVMKTNPDGTREHTHLENYQEWCTNTDTLQMNEFEISSLSKVKKLEYEIAEEILLSPDSRVSGLIVTRGIDGVSGYTKTEKKYLNEKYQDIDKYAIRAIENPRFVDTTGCGDVFAASFLLHYSKNKDFIKSIYFANRIASYKTSLEGINELHKLK